VAEKVTLTHKQRQAIPALLASGTVTAAAEAAGISRETLYRWLRTDAQFRAELHAAEALALAETTRRLVALSGHALTTITGVMLDATEPGAIRLRAADVILQRLLQLRELVTLEDRITALEESAGRERVA
jgi:transposase-like protein